MRTNSDTTTEQTITDSVIGDLKAIEHVTEVVAQQSIQGSTMLSIQHFQGRASLTGVSIDDLSLLGLEAAEGNLSLSTGATVIGSKVPENFYRMNYSGKDATLTMSLLNKKLKLTLMKNSSGKTVRKTMWLKVNGILPETSSQSDYTVYLTMSDADSIYAYLNGEKLDHDTDSYSSVIIRVDETDNVMTVADKITEMGFQATTPQSVLENINALFTVMQLVFGGIGAITLFVAAIGIANTMTMAILERTREIGLLKALGATNQNILSLFLGEAAGIGLLGGIGGVSLGLVLGKIINAIAAPYLQEQAAQSSSASSSAAVSAVYMPLYLPIFALIFSTLIGSLSGLYPSLRAASLPPVIALKHD